MMESITPMIKLFVALNIDDSDNKEYVNKDTDSQYIFPAKPHSTWYIYFSGDHIMDWLGGGGGGAVL